MSGMSMMLKSFGFDPEQIMQVITGIGQGVEAMNSKLDAILAEQSAQREILAALINSENEEKEIDNG